MGAKEKLKKYEELWSKIRDLIRSITKKSNDYDEKHMKTRFVSILFNSVSFRVTSK